MPALQAQKRTTHTSTSQLALPSDTKSVEVLGDSGREEVEEGEDEIYTEDLKGDQEPEANNPSDINDNQSDEPLVFGRLVRSGFLGPLCLD